MLIFEDFQNWLINEDQSGIIWLKLNRPSTKNAFNRVVLNELEQIIDQINICKSGRILVIGSVSDKFFTSGADISWFIRTSGPEGEEISKDIQRVFSKIENLKIPVIAAVKGICLTAGLELSLCCDFIIAADNAKFGQIETKWGLTPAGGGTQRLIRLVGPLKARELIYTSEIIDANKAYQIGLVNDVVPLEEFDDFIKNLCKKLLKNSKAAIRESKSLIQKAIYKNEEGFSEENTVFGNRIASGEPRMLFQDFFNSRNKH